LKTGNNTKKFRCSPFPCKQDLIQYANYEVEGCEVKPSCKLYAFGPVYTWRTLTGIKLNNNWTQNSKPAIFWQRNQDTEPELH